MRDASAPYVHVSGMCSPSDLGLIQHVDDADLDAIVANVNDTVDVTVANVVAVAVVTVLVVVVTPVVVSVGVDDVVFFCR